MGWRVWKEAVHAAMDKVRRKDLCLALCPCTRTYKMTYIYIHTNRWSANNKPDLNNIGLNSHLKISGNFVLSVIMRSGLKPTVIIYHNYLPKSSYLCAVRRVLCLQIYQLHFQKPNKEQRPWKSQSLLQLKRLAQEVWFTICLGLGLEATFRKV